MTQDNHGMNSQPRFVTTHWSVVLRAGKSDEDDAKHALDELIRTYWYPLYSFARRAGREHHDAMDLTQGFFVHLLSGDALGSVSPDYGHFRSFLLASFKNFNANDHRSNATVRRGGQVQVISLTSPDFATRYGTEPVDDVTPELLYERQWVQSLLDCVHSRLAREFERADKAELFRLLEPHLTFSDHAISRGEVGRQLNLSPAAVGMSIYRMRRRYGELLREEVAATIDDTANIDEEVRMLMRIVCGPAK